jgi:methyl-accepting chemotaxis protein
MMKNIKIGVKLIGGFIIVALIVLAVGFFGWNGARQLQGHIHEIGDVRLPSIESLLETELGLEELLIAQRTLMSEQLDADARAYYLENFHAARAEYSEAWEHFLTLPATTEEERLSTHFEDEIADWAQLNNRWLQLNEEFEALDILEPAGLVALIEQFQKDHYALELNVAQLLLSDREFEGGGDPTACNFGRWLRDLSTRNLELDALLDEIRDPHDRFHFAVDDIRNEYRAGNIEAAVNSFETEIRTASDEVFEGFEKLLGLADNANALRNEMNEFVVGPISDEAYEAMGIIDDLIHMNEVIAEESVLSADAAGTRVEMIALIGIILGVVLALILGVILTRGITTPLAKGVRFAEDVSSGNLNIDLDVKQKDEVGKLADALRFMLKSLQYKADKIEQIANKDLTIDIEKASDRDGLGASLILMRDSLREMLSQVNTAVDQVASGSDQVSQASQDLSQGATEQASSLEEISSSITEVNSQSKQNADNATEANGIAKQATTDAESGNTQMKELVEAMNRINASSDEINKVVKVIDDIAFQINLLALNANVEAARAGKYGKGFAVVAEEVRNLAVRAAEAVKETSSMVEDSISNIKEGNELVDKTAAQLDSIVTGSSKVAEFLGEIASASKEQAQAIDQITEGLDQIDQVTQSNTASAEESASAAEELAGQAQQLKAMIAQFKLDENDTDTPVRQITDGRRTGPSASGQRPAAKPARAVSRQSSGAPAGMGKPAPAGKNKPAPAGKPAAPGTGSAAGKPGRQENDDFNDEDRTLQSRAHTVDDGSGDETGIAPLDPAEVIKLDDDDFENF